MLTVESALKLAALSQCRLLGGAGGGNQVITSVNQMEVPDLVNWMKEGQLIVTTGYFIRNDINDQRQILIDLAQKRSAGLAIKIRRFFQSIPQHMISLADELNFPLIEIPEAYNISDVMNEVMKELLTIQARQIERSHEIHDRFTEIPLKGGGLNRIAELLGELTGGSVSITDAEGTLSSTYDPPGVSIPAIELVKLVPPTSPALLHQVIEQKAPYAETPFHTNAGSGRQITYPILADARLYGSITNWLLRDSENAVDIVSIKHAATIAGLEFLRYSAMNEMRKRYEIDFYNDLFSGQIQTRELLSRRGSLYGIQAKSYYQLIVIDIDNFTKIYLEDFAGNDQRAQLLKKRLVGIVKSVLTKEANHGLAVGQSDHVVILLPSAAKNAIRREDRERLVEEIRRKISQQIGDLSISAVLGPATEALKIHEGYSEILEVMDICSRINQKQGRTINCEDFEVEKMLAEMNPKRLHRLYQETAKILEEIDRKENLQLVQTLNVFFQCRLNHSEAARALFVHRNTLSYRLEKIKEITDIDYENNNILLKWQLGLKARQLLMQDE